MGLKRYRKKLRKAYGSVKDHISGIGDKLSDYRDKATGGLFNRIRSQMKAYRSDALDKVSETGNRIGDAAKRTGVKAREAYQRYKDPLIIGTATALGAILGSVVPVVGTAAGAGLGLSLSSAAVGGYKAHKQAKEVEKAEKAWDAQVGGLEPGGLAAALRRRRLMRGAGDAVATYESDTARGGIDEQEIAS